MDLMAQALSVARLALGQSSPNPAVGAVIVRDGVILGQGYTQPPGSAHAEVMALEQAGDAARGATLYVTLEPCCHYGRTPPCTKALIAAGIAEVHVATLDVNPVVYGKGKAELEAGGIRVYLGEREAEAKRLVEAYIKFMQTGFPFVTAKFAVSLDGKIATRSGDSRWISGEESRKYVHSLRYVSDAVLVGVNTVLADNPRLTARCCGGRGGTAKRQPLRVIADSEGRTPLTAQLFSEPGKTMLALGGAVASEKRQAFTRAGAELMQLPSEGGMLSLRDLFVALGKMGVTSVLAEGGATLLGSLFDERLVDKVIVFIAPVIIGGAGAKTAVAGRGADKLADALRLRHVELDRFGEDFVVTGYVKE